METLTLAVRPGTPPGTYRVKIGVWLPTERTRLRVAKTDLEGTYQGVIAGTFTVVR